MGRRRYDLTGQTFGRLKVLGESWSDKQSQMWRCRCTCGVVCDIRATNLSLGRTKSCGCLRAEKARATLMARRAR